MSYGPNPWQQTHWDTRAAGNFIGGGAGGGLLIATVLAGAQGTPRLVALLLALALVGGGLLCVWAEIGRPWRALNVVFHPQSSWMTREALVAPLLMGLGAASLWVDTAALPAAVAAAAFVYCQARILQAAKGIPAWREPLTVPLLVSTALAEGCGLHLALQAAGGQGAERGWWVFGALLALRFAIGARWYRVLCGRLQPAPLAAVNRAGHAFNAGTLAPLALVVGVLAAPLPSALVLVLQLVAGLGALAGGALFKWQLVTRAAFNQGFSLPHLPVRGTRR
ncbi:MAG: hypothetical protein U1F56_25690 [Rubrivivax sp.]